MITVVGYHLGTSRMCFHQGLDTLARPTLWNCRDRQLVIIHLFPQLSHVLLIAISVNVYCLMRENFHTLERSRAKIENNSKDLSVRNNQVF